VTDVVEAPTDWQRFVELHRADPRIGRDVEYARAFADSEGELLDRDIDLGSLPYQRWSRARYFFRQWRDRQDTQREARELRQRVEARSASVAPTPAPAPEAVEDREALRIAVTLLLRTISMLDDAATYGLADPLARHPRSPSLQRTNIAREAAELLERLAVMPPESDGRTV
jgi:hypothetical protein